MSEVWFDELMPLIDRRHTRRIKLRQPIKVRPASLKDGEFEDLSETENASKRGVYFLTQLRQYFVGMRIYVTLPYSSPPHPRSREYLGQILRVDRIEGKKHGVAVQFL